ncbi:hypothetical protein PRIPAC_95184 [Pristionchus pacificus]|uniref:G protein-coupled receptor n=1 Tax=Pristionchus pacificus TaxID=54126 RepID=A0A2A6D2M6_PRIPA|nr:hypothetical protein PRIPAC_95184 [Pristionchus pacificus]|eukprot:PDM84649.1 G protein-coupled receptor [Pristionchus pacificus]
MWIPIIAGFITVALVGINRKNDKIESQLNVRYQVKENLKILRVFTLIGVICVIWQAILTSLFALAKSSATSRTSFIICTDLYALTITLILLTMGSSLLQRVSWLTKKKNNTVQPAATEGELYMQMLQKQWM